METLAFEECVQDTPLFRNRLQQAEAEVEQRRTRLLRLYNTSKAMIDADATTQAHTGTFLQEISSFIKEYNRSSDEDLKGNLNKFIALLEEVSNQRSQLFYQIDTIIASSFREYVDDNIDRVKETGRVFHRLSDDVDSMRSKAASASRTKAPTSELRDLSNVLASTHSSLTHTALSYSYQLLELKLRERDMVAERMLALMFAQYTYFKQGHDLMKDAEPLMKLFSKQMTDRRSLVSEELATLRKQVETAQSAPLHNESDGSSPVPIFEGYLFKRGHNTFKTWNWRYFKIDNTTHSLIYCNREKGREPLVLVPDLRICSVRQEPQEAIDRRFAFEIVTPNKNYILQAESESVKQGWIAGLQEAIGHALHSHVGTASALSAANPGRERLDSKKAWPSGTGSPFMAPLTASSSQADSGSASRAGEPASVSDAASESDASESATAASPKDDGAASPVEPSQVQSPGQLQKSKQQRLLQLQAEVLQLSGNRECADCGKSSPTWCSINLGVVLCIECSGIHRSLGTHVSKVRSLSLDRLDMEVIPVLRSLGNQAVNGILEANLDPSEKPTPSSQRSEREAFIEQKYVKRAFVQQTEDPTATLAEAALQGDLPKALSALVCGAGVDDVVVSNAAESVTGEYLPQDAGSTALIVAAARGHVCLMTLLLLNNAEKDLPRADGKTALHCAIAGEYTLCAYVLVKWGANLSFKDTEGHTPLDVAVQHQHAETVTLLRLMQMQASEEDSVREDPADWIGVQPDDFIIAPSS